MSRINCDVLIDYFNGQLSAEDERKFEKHLSECESCQQELEELSALTSELPFDSEPVEPPTGMKDRVLAEVFTHEQEEQNEPTTQVVNFDNHQVKNKKKNTMVYALAATLFLSLAGNVFLGTQINNTADDPIDSVEVSPDKVVQSINLNSTEYMNATGQAFVLENEGSNKLLVRAENLQAVEGDQAYQVWVLEGDQPHRAGTFVPSEDGNGAVVFDLKKLDGVNWDTIAITLEPTPNSELPEGDILLAAEL